MHPSSNQMSREANLPPTTNEEEKQLESTKIKLVKTSESCVNSEQKNDDEKGKKKEKTEQKKIPISCLYLIDFGRGNPKNKLTENHYFHFEVTPTEKIIDFINPSEDKIFHLKISLKDKKTKILSGIIFNVDGNNISTNFYLKKTEAAEFTYELYTSAGNGDSVKSILKETKKNNLLTMNFQSIEKKEFFDQQRAPEKWKDLKISSMISLYFHVHDQKQKWKDILGTEFEKTEKKELPSKEEVQKLLFSYRYGANFNILSFLCTNDKYLPVFKHLFESPQVQFKNQQDNFKFTCVDWANYFKSKEILDYLKKDLEEQQEKEKKRLEQLSRQLKIFDVEKSYVDHFIGKVQDYIEARPKELSKGNKCDLTFTFKTKEDKEKGANILNNSFFPSQKTQTPETSSGFFSSMVNYVTNFLFKDVDKVTLLFENSKHFKHNDVTHGIFLFLNISH
jgi:hypothetical protein